MHQIPIFVNLHVPHQWSQCIAGNSHHSAMIYESLSIVVKMWKFVVFYSSVSYEWTDLYSLPQVELVRWTQSVGLTLVNRDLNSLQLKTPSGQILSFHILQIFPFTSESKRMGIIVRVWSSYITILCVDAVSCVMFLLFSHAPLGFLCQSTTLLNVEDLNLCQIWVLCKMSQT